MKLAAKITTGVSVLVVVGLVALVTPVIVAVLPHSVQVALGGTIDTVPGTVDELFARTGLGEDGQYGDAKVTHAEVDEEYVLAATIWPWSLPPDWKFPKSRGAGDTPGYHWNGMGVKAAFSIWASASLEAVKAGDLSPDAANDLLDEVQAAYQTLLDEGVLSDRGFIAESVTPLRP
jgi:hypothetical protein